MEGGTRQQTSMREKRLGDSMGKERWVITCGNERRRMTWGRDDGAQHEEGAIAHNMKKAQWNRAEEYQFWKGSNPKIKR